MGLFDFLGGGGGYKDPSKAAQPYLNQVPGTIKPYYDPYINAGQQAQPILQNQFQKYATNPTGALQDIGSQFRQSPGYDWRVKQGEQAVAHANAAGGMAGSPQHEQQAADMVGHLADQDYNDWISHVLGIQSMGLEGESHLNDMGYNASNELAQSLGNNLLTQGSLGYAGTANRNSARGGAIGAGAGFLGNVFNAAGNAGSFGQLFGSGAAAGAGAAGAGNIGAMLPWAAESAGMLL